MIDYYIYWETDCARLHCLLSNFQNVGKHMQDIWWWIQTIYNCSYYIYRTTKQESFCLFWRVFLKKTIFVFIFIKICCVFLFYVLKHKRYELFWTKTPMIKKICFGKLLQFFIYWSSFNLTWNKNNLLYSKNICWYAGRWMMHVAKTGW